MIYYPYRLLVHWQDGRTTVQAQGHNPVEVRRAEAQVSRNPRAIRRIELHDSGGCVDAIWDASWDLT